MNSLAKKLTAYQLLSFVILGLLFGFFISRIVDLPQRLLAIILVGVAFPFIAAIIGDVRRFLMVAIVVTIPLRIDANLIRIFENQAGASNLGISITDIFIIILLFWWIVELVTRDNTRVQFYPRITIPIILYFQACLLTLLWAPRLDLAALELIQMVKVILLYFILVNQIHDISDVKLIAWSLVMTVAFEGALANLQGVFGKSLDLGFLGELQGSERDVEAGKMFRVGGTLGHPNRLAMYLELLMPLCLSMAFIAGRKRLRIFVYGVFGIALIAMIVSGSRGGWIGVVIGLFVFFYFLIRTRHLNFRQLIAPMVLALLMMALVAYAYSDVLQKRLQGDDFGSAESRIPMFQIAVNVIEAHPLGGVGINNYQVKMKNYMKTVHALRYRSIDRPVHNMYLLIAGETGFFGLFVFLLLVFFLIKTLVHTAYSPSIECAIIAIGLFGGLIAFLTHGLVDKHSPGGYALFYAFMALTAAMHQVSNQASNEQ